MIEGFLRVLIWAESGDKTGCDVLGSLPIVHAPSHLEVRPLFNLHLNQPEEQVCCVLAFVGSTVCKCKECLNGWAGAVSEQGAECGLVMLGAVLDRSI
jgi:hypothetical protein